VDKQVYAEEVFAGFGVGCGDGGGGV